MEVTMNIKEMFSMLPSSFWLKQVFYGELNETGTVSTWRILQLNLSTISLNRSTFRIHILCFYKKTYWIVVLCIDNKMAGIYGLFLHTDPNVFYPFCVLQ